MEQPVGSFSFDFKRLDVYRAALEYFRWAAATAARIPRDRRYIADQFMRAALSIVLNIAEGAGRRSPGEKGKHYRYAGGSAAESAATPTPNPAVRPTPSLPGSGAPAAQKPPRGR